MLYLPFLLGSIIGLVLCVIYDHFLNGIERGYAFLHLLEHYHWAELLILFFKKTNLTLFLGFAFTLVVDEQFQRNPFAYGKKHFLESTALGVLFFLFIVLC